MKKELKLSGILSFSVLALMGCKDMNQKDAEKPNILFIMADDHTSQAWGIYGGILEDYVHTPNIHRLAEEGCVLNNCLVSNSISVPSRATILTGQYSHLNGANTLGGGLDPEKMNIAKMMSQGGYQTSMIGKWHLKKQPSGFDHFCVLPGQGRYWDPIMKTKNDWDQGGQAYEGFSTDVIADMTIEWLKDRNKDRPFFAMCHFKATHEPFDYPDRHEHRYRDVKIPAPATLFDRGPETTGRTFMGQSIDNLQKRYLTATQNPERRRGHMDYPELPFSVDGLEKDKARMKTYQKFVKDFMRSGAAIDDNIGKLLDYLDEAGLAENTVVIYTADQGYFLGEHGWFDKRLIYEESIHMPFVIRYPEEIPAGTRNDDIIENADFSALFADYAGVEYPSSMQGYSFRSNLKGNTPGNWRDYGYYRYWQHSRNRPGHFGIRGKRYKLAFFYGNGLEEWEEGESPGFWEFYDLKKDPNELHNAYDDPEYKEIIAKMKQVIRRKRKLLKDTDADNRNIRKIISNHWND